jgi:transcriptional regulator with XRE-family HTH domain
MKTSERLHELRLKLNLTQPQIAEKFHISLPSWKSMEKGPSEPSAPALRCLYDGGVNIIWILTGDGEMLLADQANSQIAPSPIDKELLLYVIEGVETHLSQNKLTLKPDRKALLIQLIYEYCSLDTEAKKPATVERFLKLVA